MQFTTVEAKIAKWQSKQSEEWLRGGWHTDVSLTQMGWTEPLGRYIDLLIKCIGCPFKDRDRSA